ncbi:MAG: orotate phosphoribosyltransferase [Actinomycetota bacterium]|nr:orotate phosphoribosyltransferase [Actinomycetota bacterium]
MDKDGLIAHLKKFSIQEGDFVLKSGRKSGWFCDAKQTICRPEGMLLVAQAALEVIPENVQAIGGLTAGADPVAFGIAAAAARDGRFLRSFSIRKESKDHGVKGRLAGALELNDRVVICEDTVTRGTSPLEAARVVRELGGVPVMIIAVVDRGGTCASEAEKEGISFHALISAPELGFNYENQ